MEETSINKNRKIDRFDKYVIFKGLNDNKVTTDLCLSVGTLGKSRKNNRDLSDRTIELILNYYTDLSRVWLLTGEGEMIKTEPPKIGSQQSSEMVAMPRELLDLLLSQQRTMEMQQKTVEAQQRITESQQGNFAKLTEAITELAKKGGNVEKPFRAASVVVEDE